MMRHAWNVATALLLSAASYQGLAAETEVKLNLEEGVSFPWNITDDKGLIDGLDLITLRMVDEQLPDVKFTYLPVPWKRCLKNMEDGVVQGCFTASYKAERDVHGFYPGTHNKKEVDKSLMIHSSTYSLYVLKGSPISVDANGNITGLKAADIVGAPLGYSIAEDLKAKGVNVDTGARGSDTNLGKLLKGRIAALALLSADGDYWINKNPEYKEKVVELKPPLVDKPYYVMFNKEFVNKNKDLAEKIWKKIAEVRDSKALKEKQQEWMAKQ